MIARKVGLLLVALFLVLLSAGLALASSTEDDSLWVEAELAVKSGNRSESLRLLRLCVLGRLNLPDSELILRQTLASETADICSGRPVTELTSDELGEFHRLQSEICGLGVADAGDWLLLMKASMAMPGSQNLIVSGQAFLDAVHDGLPVAISQDWRDILAKLDIELVRDEQVLYRLQIAQIFAGLAPESKALQQKLDDARLVADAKAVKILRFAEVEMALGNLSSARACLDRVRNFDPTYSGLDEMYRLLERAERIDKILVQANDALIRKSFDEAKRYADEVFSLDPNNFFARRVVEQVEEARQRPVGAALKEADRVQLKIRRLEAELRVAEKEEDLLKMSLCLREILMLKNDPAYALKLADVDEEIAFSRLKSEERFAEAEILFRKGEYAKLRLFLNRNPGLMNSLETLVQIWEMRLMVNFVTGYIDSAQLRAAALEIKRRAGRSFYASYVLMRLDLAENKFAAAREHYKVAAELKPGDVSLRWPGLLLWVHGDGRPVAVIVLLVVFLLLIKLIVPFFSWFESTYWWRITLLSKVFPSLAIGSLESCFGSVYERSKRITLFTLLMKSCYRVGKYDKALLYAENLLELVPGCASALEIRGKIKGRPARAGKAQESEEKQEAAIVDSTPVPEERPVIKSGLRSDFVEETVEETCAEAVEDAAEYADEEALAETVEDAVEYAYEEPLAEAVEDAVEYAYEEPLAEADEDVGVAPFESGLDREYSGGGLAVAGEEEMPAEFVASASGAAVLEPTPVLVETDKSKEKDMIWYDDEEEQKSKEEGIAEVMVGLFNDFFSEKPAVAARDERVRHELFGELDSMQAPEPVSDAWLNCDGSAQRGHLFKDLDQGR
ncbi:MAG: hypothetical protein CVV42_12485 [Candidatus Riflebacteria bacterium HGW-Riflebacteria-2]|jgi:tetratricopeptide (TPR) repeat protein|nr:MAG: hypothetical protein CVV42_12485 [Candidatus Riflebacteria bacterium HGW-Riflebacteria-2]